MMVQVLRVLTAGITSTPCLELRPREPAQLVIGSAHGWILRGPGVAASHAMVYFDGNTLHLASIDPYVPVLVDGEAIPNAWTAIDPPCRIEIGSVELALVEEAPEPHALARSGPFKALEQAKPFRWPWAVVGALFAGGLVLAFHLAPLQEHAPSPRREQPAPTATPPPQSTPHKASTVAFPANHPPHSGKGKTPERLAADAFHAGDRRRAAKLYEDLAARRPDNPAFAAAAMILASMPN